MREERVEVDAVVDDELGALGLADAAEGPRAVDRQLLVDDVGADVEGGGVAFADEADAAPWGCALDGVGASVRVTGAVERGGCAFAVCEVFDGATGSSAAGSMTVSAPKSEASLRRSGEKSTAMTRAPIAFASSVRAEAHRSLAVDGEGVAAGDVKAAQGVEGGAGAAGDGGALLEGEGIVQGHEHCRRDGHVLGVAAVGRGAVDEMLAGDAHLGVADATVLAQAAAAVVVDHDALVDRRLVLGDGAAAGNDDAAGLVAADDGERLIDRYGGRSLPHMPEAFIWTTTSRGPGAGSGKSRTSSLRSPRKTMPFKGTSLWPLAAGRHLWHLGTLDPHPSPLPRGEGTGHPEKTSASLGAALCAMHYALPSSPRARA